MRLTRRNLSQFVLNKIQDPDFFQKFDHVVKTALEDEARRELEFLDAGESTERNQFVVEIDPTLAEEIRKESRR